MARRVRSFPPLAEAGATRLVLGSMPGVASLEAREYYAHPRNAFWPIMAEACGFEPSASYADRCAGLTGRGVALWDVLRSCRRDGSLDAAIQRDSEIANDFGSFFAEQPLVRVVLFNGQKAEAAFRRHAAGSLPAPTLDRLRFERLPSTSPANASVPFARKRAAWLAAIAAPV